MLNVSEVLTILEKEGLTSSRQVVLRWIRQGDLPAIQKTRKEGYQVAQPDLDEFIARKKEVSCKHRIRRTDNRRLSSRLPGSHKRSVGESYGEWGRRSFSFQENASIPIHLADFKEMAARNFSTGKNNPFYQAAIKNLFHPFGRKTPKNVIYVYPLGDYYKLANLIVSKEELSDFMKEMDLEGASLSDVFAHLYLYYLTSGKVK